MFYISAHRFSVLLHDGRASITYFGKTSVSMKKLTEHCVSVGPDLRQQAESEARKMEAEYLANLIKENEALKDELESLKENQPIQQEAA